jgi:hypothetical protein
VGSAKTAAAAAKRASGNNRFIEFLPIHSPRR